MIKSDYINDILNLLLDCDEKGLLARKQIPFLTEKDFNYTGSGLFVSFEQSIGIDKYETEKKNLVLDGVKITSAEYQNEANAMLFFKNGLIEELEIWCYEGDYPNSDLKSYVLTQTWLNSDNKTIIKN